MEAEPWKIVNHLFPDLVLVVEGKKLYYHQAVLVQHSALVKSLLLQSSCCKCGGSECSRNSGNVFITLDNVRVTTVQYVMDFIYTGGGSLAGDTEEYKKVVDMLQINTIIVDKVDAPDGFDIDLVKESTTLELKEEDKVVQNEIKEETKEKKTDKRNKRQIKNKKTLNKEEETKDKIKLDNKAKESEPGGKEIPIPTGDKLVKLVENYVVVKDDEKGEITTKTKDDKNIRSVEDSELKKNIHTEIIIDDDPNDGKDVIVQSDVGSESDRFCCPFKDCRSESRSAQSIKVHLALVHYKKTIQAEFPNWRRQKCDQCDKSFGQMTAYYLHMANHKRYPFMDLPSEAMRTPNISSLTPSSIIPQAPTVINSISTKTQSMPPGPPSRVNSSLSSPNWSNNSVIKNSSNMSQPQGLGRSNSFVMNNKTNQNVFSRSKSFVQNRQQVLAQSLGSNKPFSVSGLSSVPITQNSRNNTSFTPVTNGGRSVTPGVLTTNARSGTPANRSRTSSVPLNTRGMSSVSLPNGVPINPRNTSNTPANTIGRSMPPGPPTSMGSSAVPRSSSMSTDGLKDPLSSGAGQAQLRSGSFVAGGQQKRNNSLDRGTGKEGKKFRGF